MGEERADSSWLIVPAGDRNVSEKCASLFASNFAIQCLHLIDVCSSVKPECRSLLSCWFVSSNKIKCFAVNKWNRRKPLLA